MLADLGVEPTFARYCNGNTCSESVAKDRKTIEQIDMVRKEQRADT